MFRSVDVDFVDVDAAQDVVGVIGWAAPHGDQVEDFRLLAAFLPTHFALGTFVLVALKKKFRIDFTFVSLLFEIHKKALKEYKRTLSINVFWKTWRSEIKLLSSL